MEGEGVRWGFERLVWRVGVDSGEAGVRFLGQGLEADLVRQEFPSATEALCPVHIEFWIVEFDQLN
jgi:hypothetical protein